jgi:hypothetical protein
MQLQLRMYHACMEVGSFHLLMYIGRKTFLVGKTHYVGVLLQYIFTAL